MNNARQRLFRRLLLALVFCGTLLCAKPQDAAYSQAFLSPVYLNPAATGAGDHDLRISAIYRRQWWLVPSNFHSMAFSVDKYLPNYNSGVGLLVTTDRAGYLHKNGLYGTFAYTICAATVSPADNGGLPKWFLSGGFQAGVGQSRLDYSKLFFADQLNTNGAIYPSVSAADPLANSGRLYPDLGAGAFFNWTPSDNLRLLFGLSAHHVNRPDESLTSGTESPLPVKWTGNFAASFRNPASDWAWTFTGIGYRQAAYRRYRLGVEVTHNDYSNISAGLLYAGGWQKGDLATIGFSVSLNLFNARGQKVRAGIGHDAQVGGKGYMRTGGSTEAGFVWDYSTTQTETESPCKPQINSLLCWPFQQ